MADDGSLYGLPDKDPFDRENIAKRFIGKIVRITSGDNMMGGVLAAYAPGDFAVLRPYISIVNGKIRIVDEECFIEQPHIVSISESKTIDDFIVQDVKPGIIANKKKKEK